MAEELSFGKWLRKRRRALDLTQQTLADETGCARITLRRIEADALKPSRELAWILLEKVGIPPAQRETWLRFARGQSGLPSEGASSAKPQTNLPASLTSFIGREKEQAEVIQLIDKRRLITLTGSGGVGKTRLSLKVGEQASRDFADGVWLVELAPLNEPELLPQTVAAIFGVTPQTNLPIAEVLLNFLREKNVLLLLDNCEHLLDACAHFADTLLKNCPNLKILATSRETLGITGEAAYRVPSLGLPNLQRVLQNFRDYESVRLFEERAQLIQNDFALTLENASSVAQICLRLDGIPLAIELAAARIHMFSTEQIAAQLDECFRLLTGGSRTALPRQQTLRASVDWSWNLLTEAEQTLLRRLSIFAGGWTLESAQAICGGDVLNLTSALVKKSLVMADQEGGRETRYRFHEIIRQYVREKLSEAGENDLLFDRHLEYFLNLAETAEPRLRRAEQIEWLEQLDAEHDNLRAALEWALGKESAEFALRLASAVETFWEMRSYWLEGAKWLDRALNKEWERNGRTEKAVRARALYCRAALTFALYELEVLKTSADSALALCEEVGDPWGVAYSRALVATHRLFLRTPRTSIPLFEQSLSEFHEMGDTWAESRVASGLARALSNTGIREGYLEARQRAIDCARASGDRYLIANTLMNFVDDWINHRDWGEAETILREIEQRYAEVNSPRIHWIYHYWALVHFIRGNLEKAKSNSKRFIEFCIQVGERIRQAITLFLLALIAESEHNLPSALDYGRKGLSLWRELNNPAHIAMCLPLVGLLEYRQGNAEIGRQHARESLEITRRGEAGPWTLLYVFSWLGGFFVEKNPQAAIQILAASDSLSRLFPTPRDAIFDQPYYDRFLAAARAKLSEAEFASAWEAGLNLPLLDGAIDLALKSLDEM